jgi:ribonuclease Z
VARNYDCELTLAVTEIASGDRRRRAIFRLRDGFVREDVDPPDLPRGLLHEDSAIEVRGSVLDHGIPCLGFSVQEKMHVNIFKTRLEELGLPTGPWLRELRREVIRGAPDDTPIRIWRRGAEPRRERFLPLGFLRQEVMQIVPGQKVAYVVDVRHTPENVRRITELARDADLLFIEAAFLDAEADHAARKHHLTARQAGLLAREAKAKALVPIHFSPRYEGREDELRREARTAFGERPE